MTNARILVAVDGSSTSDVALAQAIELARLASARLLVLHVVDSPYAYPDVLYGQVPGDAEELRAAWRKAGKEVLEQAMARVRGAGADAEERLFEDGGHASAAIVQEAQRWGADLIVVGTHGRRGVQRWLLGSVAERVARTAPVSVLLVRGTAAPAGGAGDVTSPEKSGGQR